MIVFSLVVIKLEAITINSFKHLLNQLQILIKILTQFRWIEYFSANLTIFFIISVVSDSWRYWTYPKLNYLLFLKFYKYYYLRWFYLDW